MLGAQLDTQVILCRIHLVTLEAIQDQCTTQGLPIRNQAEVRPLAIPPILQIVLQRLDRHAEMLPPDRPFVEVSSELHGDLDRPLRRLLMRAQPVLIRQRQCQSGTRRSAFILFGLEGVMAVRARDRHTHHDTPDSPTFSYFIHRDRTQDRRSLSTVPVRVRKGPRRDHRKSIRSLLKMPLHQHKQKNRDHRDRYSVCNFPHESRTHDLQKQTLGIPNIHEHEVTMGKTVPVGPQTRLIHSARHNNERCHVTRARVCTRAVCDG